MLLQIYSCVFLARLRAFARVLRWIVRGSGMTILFQKCTPPASVVGAGDNTDPTMGPTGGLTSSAVMLLVAYVLRRGFHSALLCSDKSEPETE